WNNAETDALVDYLHEHRGERGDGGGFKEQTYNAAAIAIAIHRTAGPEKTGKMVLTKWNAIFNAVEAYRGLSGTHWDNVHGATI
ncbi:hypothetical protein BV22DRAFT_980834, partial [Leucogyrophana mollusca]